MMIPLGMTPRLSTKLPLLSPLMIRGANPNLPIAQILIATPADATSRPPSLALLGTLMRIGILILFLRIPDKLTQVPTLDGLMPTTAPCGFDKWIQIAPGIPDATHRELRPLMATGMAQSFLSSGPRLPTTMNYKMTVKRR